MSEITLEQVEKIRVRAQVGYEDAKAALEASGGDLLDAMIWLERRGIGRTGAQQTDTQWDEAQTAEPKSFGHSGFYSTRGGGSGDSAEPVFTESGAGYQSVLRELLNRSIVVQFEVWRRGRRVVSMPVLVGILLLIVAPWVAGPLLLVGLLAGCRYRFAGSDEEAGDG